MKRLVLSVMLVCMTLITSILTYADTPQTNDTKKLSLNQAIDEAIKNSTDLKVSDLDIEIKEIELDQAKRSEKKYENSDFSLGTVEGFQLDANMYSKAAQNALDEEKIKKDYKIEDLKYKTTQAYYGALQAKDYYEVTKNNLANAQKSRDNVKKKYDLGVASKSDLYMGDIALDEAKANLETSKIKMQSAYRGLNMALNYPLDTKLELTSKFEQQKFDVDLTKDILNAYEKRFDMIQINNNYEIVKLDFKTNSTKYPSNTYVYKTKERNVAKVENLMANSKQMVEFDIKSKYDNVNNNKRQIEIAKSNVDKANEVLRLKKLSYDAGMSTLLEVQEAANTAYSANIALSQAISAYNLSIIDYNKAVNIGTVR
ncbi:TolC family protein [Tepidibacter aestuarii]|uniref:TolC family protein n=1 Tax=Tepidibacter aestuarii TaxID=2925782 RepID=UPI0020BEF9CA|nr:TolC family protein [Tepidibacter aestuarii]CAH2215042.1 Outer membrane protein TolC [Tepidibacter aestuarii]